MGVSHNVNINIIAMRHIEALHIPEYWIIHKRGDIGCFTKHIELLSRQPMTPKMLSRKEAYKVFSLGQFKIWKRAYDDQIYIVWVGSTLGFETQPLCIGPSLKLWQFRPVSSSKHNQSYNRVICLTSHA